MSHPREIQHDVHVRVAERDAQFARRGAIGAAAQHHDAGQGFEAGVVAFRIHDARAVPLENQLLAEQPGDPRLARLGIADNQDVATANGQRDRLPRSVLAKRDVPAAHAVRGNSRLLGCRANVGGDG